MFLINSKSLGLAGGVIWGVFIMLVTWITLLTGCGFVFLSTLADLYPGYSISFLGSIVGLIWGFVAGFIKLYALGWLYNFFEH